MFFLVATTLLLFCVHAVPSPALHKFTLRASDQVHFKCAADACRYEIDAIDCERLPGREWICAPPRGLGQWLRLGDVVVTDCLSDRVGPACSVNYTSTEIVRKPIDTLCPVFGLSINVVVMAIRMATLGWVSIPYVDLGCDREPRLPNARLVSTIVEQTATDDGDLSLFLFLLIACMLLLYLRILFIIMMRETRPTDPALATVVKAEATATRDVSAKLSLPENIDVCSVFATRAVCDGISESDITMLNKFIGFCAAEFTTPKDRMSMSLSCAHMQGLDSPVNRYVMTFLLPPAMALDLTHLQMIHSLQPDVVDKINLAPYREKHLELTLVLLAAPSQ